MKKCCLFGALNKSYKYSLKRTTWTMREKVVRMSTINIFALAGEVAKRPLADNCLGAHVSSVRLPKVERLWMWLVTIVELSWAQIFLFKWLWSFLFNGCNLYTRISLYQSLSDKSTKRLKEKNNVGFPLIKNKGTRYFGNSYPRLGGKN